MAGKTASERRKLPGVERRGPKKGSPAELAERFERTTGKPAEGSSFRAFTAQQRGEEPPGGKDARPASAGPRGGSRVAVGHRPASGVSRGARSLDRRLRGFLRLGAGNPRKVLILELVAVLLIVTVDQLAHGDVPSPRAYVAPFIVYLILGFAAELGGDGGARVATGLGLLVLVALVLANAPGIVKTIQVASGQRASAQEGVG
jgi:hypothetical protein